MVFAGHAIFEKLCRAAEPGLKMRLAKQPGLIAVVTQPVRNGRLILRQRYPVHPDAMAGHVLPGHDRGPGWHADDILVMRPGVIDACRCQVIDHRCSSDLPAIAAKRIEAHLVGSNQ